MNLTLTYFREIHRVKRTQYHKENSKTKEKSVDYKIQLDSCIWK